MKAELESVSLAHRGILLISENEEEKQVLRRLWLERGRPVMFGKMPDGNVELAVAPTPEESHV